MNKNAFTLAEVLITLVIIGVIAAMTIPTLMGNTNKQEFKAAFKKAISAANQAVALDYALYGNDVPNQTSDNLVLARAIRNHLSVMKCHNENCTIFQTSDGMYFDVDVNCGFLVDTNGPEKGPNTEGEDSHRVEFYNCTRTVVPTSESGTALFYD